MLKGNESHIMRGIRNKEQLATKLLSVMQLKCKLQTCSQCFLVLLNKVEEDESMLEIPVEMQPLATEFADVFAAPPSGPPPARNVGHAIPLEPGVVPPLIPLYRLSPLEQAEAKHQIEEYLANGPDRTNFIPVWSTHSLRSEEEWAATDVCGSPYSEQGHGEELVSIASD